MTTNALTLTGWAHLPDWKEEEQAQTEGGPYSFLTKLFGRSGAGRSHLGLKWTLLWNGKKKERKKKPKKKTKLIIDKRP